MNQGLWVLLVSSLNGHLGQHGQHARYLVATAPFSEPGSATRQRGMRVLMEAALNNSHVTRVRVLRNGASGACVLFRAQPVRLVKSSVVRNLAVALAWAVRVVTT